MKRSVMIVLALLVAVPVFGKVKKTNIKNIHQKILMPKVAIRLFHLYKGS